MLVILSVSLAVGNGYNVFARGQAVCDFGLCYVKVLGVEVKMPIVQSFSGCDKPARNFKKWRVRKIMARLPKNRLNKMRRLSTMIEPMVAHSARERGFASAASFHIGATLLGICLIGASQPTSTFREVAAIMAP